jgi:hypothetical protein
VTPSHAPDAEEVVNRFWFALGKHAASKGWGIARELQGHSNRTFILGTEAKEIRFVAKLSQSNNGFWGISPEKADEIARGDAQFLILLTGPFSGYVIPSLRLRRLLPEFSQDAKGAQYKINEGKLRQQYEFRTIIKLWDYLQPAELAR